MNKRNTKCPRCHFENPSDTVFCGKCAAPLHPEDQPTLTKTMETPFKELAIGSTFAGRYQIIEALGKGGMGRVYKAVDKEIGEKVALKLLKPEIAADEQTIERFRNELKTARQVSHKNVCRMYHLGRDQSTHYITMEYVSGEDLKSTILRVGQLSVGKAISVIKQVCEGLAEAHSLGVVHRDLKPQNIMIDKEGNAKVMDFGIARSIKAKGITEAGVLIGTPEYMSPEQVDGKEADKRADIYALGIILYEMLTGRVPFEGDTPFSIAYKQKNEPPPDPRKTNPQIPEELSRLMLRCLEKQKEKRYPGAEELRLDLEKIEKGIPTTERVIPKRRPLTSRELTVTLKMKKLWIPGLVLIAIVAAALTVWKVFPLREADKHSIAVISFANQTGDMAYDYLQEAIPNLLITSLEQSGDLSITTWERMHDLRKQAGKSGVSLSDRDLGFELCRMDGVEAIVLGSYIRAGDVFATDVKVLDVETKKLLKSASSKGEGVQSILEKQIGELSREIAKGVGLSSRKAEAARSRIADLTTSSMEAYNFYLRGKEEYEKFYYDEARQSLEKAVSADPNFAVAFLWLSEAYDALNRTKERDEALRRAKALAEKTTEKERLYIEARYAHIIEKDSEKRVRILQEIAEKYPKEKQVHSDLGEYYGGKGMHEQAVMEFSKALALDPNFGYVLNQMAYAYSDMGKSEKALEYFRRYVSVSPGDANPIDSMAELLFRMGNLEEAKAKYKEALQVKPDFFSSMAGLANIHALEEDYSEAMKWLDRFIEASPSSSLRGSGYFSKSFYNFWLGSSDQALSELSRLVDLADAVEFGLGKAITEFLMGLIYCEKREYEKSRRYFKSWLAYYEGNSSVLPRYKAYNSFLLGIMELGEGRIDTAKARLEEIKAVLPVLVDLQKEDLSYRCSLLEGSILMAEGAIDRAIAALEKTPSPGRPPNIQTILIYYNIPFLQDALARAYEKKGELDKAVAEYERLTTFNPSREERCLIYPKQYYRLAKLYEKIGKKDKAIVAYQKFLDLWKNADSGLPDVADAKKRLASLK